MSNKDLPPEQRGETDSIHPSETTIIFVSTGQYPTLDTPEQAWETTRPYREELLLGLQTTLGAEAAQTVFDEHEAWLQKINQGAEAGRERMPLMQAVSTL